jgi:VWFA-related protein
MNQKLREELLKLKKESQERINEDIRENRKPDALIERMRESREKNAIRLCTILKSYGWPTKSLVGQDGVEAAFFVLRNSSARQLNVDLIPVIVAAVRQGEISRPGFSSFIDRMRLGAGLKQLFGTQATISDGFLVLFPIEVEAEVDARRKQFELPPLADYLRFLQAEYRLPLIKSTGALANKFSESMRSSIAKTTSADLFDGQTVAEDEVVRVDSNLVSLNVSVYSTKLRTHVTALGQKDFTVSEDGHEQTISFFATTEVPFDLVLLIDLSGSTAGKRNLIRKSTRRFIDAARPSDRLAIVTFADTPTVVSPLTDDRVKLSESVSKMEGNGGSNVWDALKFTLDQVIGPKTLARRRAVVFMTDGVDNALGEGQRGSTISFADLLEAVRRNDTLIIPIFLDTENDEYSNSFTNRIYENARKTLARLADESGGLYYKAKKIEDLDGVYGQVIEDLGKVYSVGYKPTNEKRDRTWRDVKIQLPNSRI